MGGEDDLFATVMDCLAFDFLSCDRSSDGWVFWTPESYETDANISRITTQITHVLKKMMPKNLCPMAQFWAPKEVSGKVYLTTLDQPFAVTNLKFCEQRKICAEHVYVVDDGPPGRVFRSGHPESSPNLRLYSIEEFPLRDSIPNTLEQYLALPIFDSQSNKCVGVLETLFLWDISVNYVFERIEYALQEVEMRSTHTIRLESNLLEIKSSSTHCVEYQGQQPREIKEMLEFASESVPQLRMAQVWVPCKQCPNNLVCMERVADLYHVSKMFHSLDFLEACKFHGVQSGKGVTGLAMSSANSLCFCQDIRDFSISEYPILHYALRAGLSFCFSICLQSINANRSDLYAFEFFFDQESNVVEYQLPILICLLSIMKLKLKHFELANGQPLGEEFIIQYHHEMEHHPSKRLVNLTCHGMDSDRSVEEEQSTSNACSAGGNTRSKQNGDRNKSSFNISYEDLQCHFGSPLEDAAKTLGVSRSTLKRVCRTFDISRWPSNMKNKKNPSLFRAKIGKMGSQNSSHQRNNKICKGSDVVIIKARLGDDTIKFELNSSSGIENLNEEVSKRLNLKKGSFKLKYDDEDDDCILLTCDDDLHLCLEGMKSLGKATLKFTVALIPS